MKINMRIAILVAVLLLPLPAFAGPNILLLHSYHPGYEWTDRIQEGMALVLDQEASDAELHIEYMDTKRHAPEALFPRLRRYYASKYAGRNFDAILCSDDNALDFLLAFRGELFPEVPVLFCGINNFDKERFSGQSGFTGVTEEFDLRGTLEIALQLHPQSRQVAAVSDVTTSGRANLERLKQIVPLFSKRVEFIELAGLTTPELKRSLASLPPHSIVLYLSYYLDPAGQSFSLEEGLGLITESTECPVYAAWDYKILDGVVGGRVVSGRVQGETAARLALRVLRGEPVDSIPVVRESPNVYMFDYPSLQRFDIDRADLPRDSVILRDAEAGLRKHRRKLYMTIGLAVILGLLATGLVAALLDRQRAFKAVKENRQLFRTVADFTYDWELWSSPDGRLEYISPSCERITGYSPEQFLDDLQLLERIVHPEDLQAYREHLGTSEVTSLEFRIVTRDGRVRWIEHICRKVYDDQGTYLGRRASNREITERKSAERARRECESTFQAMLQSIPDCVWMLDSNLHIAWANDMTIQTFGEQNLGARCHEVFHRQDGPCEPCLCTIGDLFGGNLLSHTYETEMIVASGQKRHFHCSANVATRDEAGSVTGVMIVARDVTEQRRAETALRESGELHRIILNNISDALFITDNAGQPTFVCPNVAGIFGLSQEEAWECGRLTALLGEDLFAWEELMWRGGISNIERSIDTGLGTSRSLLINVKRVDIKGGTVLYACRDITEKRRAEKDYQKMAYFDALTGLANRTLLNDHFHLALEQAKREQKMVAVLLLDLDNFKHVNDSLGHARGDLLLQEVARRLVAETRKCDTVARWGGDEFVLLMTEKKDESFTMAASERILERLCGEPFELEGNEIFVSASIGIALFPEDGATPEALLQHADAAMYEAKKSGRNAYRFFSQSLFYKAVERNQMESRLRRALKKEEFFLVYQPQFDLRNGRVFGGEALVRWQDPEEGLILPADFIPLAEETGLIRPLGEWVLRTACSQAAAWQEQGHGPLQVAVNLSAQQFRQPDLLQLIEGILRETGLDPQLLELELTESVLLGDAAAIEILDALKAQGIRCAIDDFGTGYSSLSYLKHLPIDRIKIAQEFVRDVPADLDNTAIVEAILAMTKGLGKCVIAEGVETEEQMSFLYERGCREMQGYYFARPMAVEDIEALLENGQILTIAAG